jgi:hypothetical protein
MFKHLLGGLALLALASAGWGQPELFTIDFQRLPVWSYPAIDRGPVVGDLTGDGVPEIVVVACGEGSNIRDQILVHDAAHSAETMVGPDDLPAGYEINGTPAIADIDGDGRNELIVTAWWAEDVQDNDGNCTSTPAPLFVGYHWHSRICTWKFGDEITSSTYYPTTTQFGGKLITPAVADVTGPDGLMPDGVDDLVFVSIAEAGVHQNNDLDYDLPWQVYKTTVYRWTGIEWTRDFTEEEAFRDCSPLYNHVPVYFGDEAMPAVGDVDGDGRAEILALLPEGNDGYAVVLVYRDLNDPLDYSRTVLTGKYLVNGVATVNPPGESLFAPVLCDYDHDGQLECVFPVRQNAAGVGLEQIATVEFTDIQPTATYWNLPTGMSTLGQAVMAVSDEGDNNDHRLGVFVSAYTDVNLIPNFLWLDPQSGNWMQGIPPLNWPKQVSSAEAWWEQGYTPAIFRTWNGTNPNDLEFLSLTGQASSGSNRLRHFRLDNTYGPDPDPREVMGQRYLKNLSGSSVADVNGDGFAELVTMASGQQTDATVYALEVGSYNPELVEWDGYQNGPKHTGLYAQPVTGAQPLTSMVWSGRITVSGSYAVGPAHTLTIEPGTVVEFRPGASLKVWGTLVAEGTQHDSIYFKADGTSKWHGIELIGGQRDVTLHYCVIHGCSTAVFASGSGHDLITHCRIYDVVNVGVDVTLALNGLVFRCIASDISGGFYGIRGVSSAGNFEDNVIHDCGRSGIYWYGDRGTTPPTFVSNQIVGNGVGTGPIAGSVFISTTARLECNTFQDNLPYQMLCDGHADVVMSQTTGRNNLLRNAGTGPWCVDCQQPTTIYNPLMYLSGSKPLLKYGHNSFSFGNTDGTFIFDRSNRCPRTYVIDLIENFYYANGHIEQRPAPGNLHFCPTDGYIDQNPLQFAPSCVPTGGMNLAGAELLFQTAATDEEAGQFAEAKEVYGQVVEEYPETPEAYWSTRGYLRAGLQGEVPAYLQHDSLYALWQDESLPMNVRGAARREAVWALVAGEDYGTARTELEAITAETANEDSLWAVVTLELVTLLENGGPGIQSIGNEHSMQSEVASFHERLHQLMGRQTDEELRTQATIPASHQLATAYPNPFNSTVTLQFELPEAGQARLEIFNLLGQKVATVLNETLPAGTHTRLWKANDVPSGVYFYRFRTGGNFETHKLLLLK